MPDNDITEDAILGGRVRVRQPARGYRVNVDTALLAAAFPRAELRASSVRVGEPCCGVAAALLAVASGYNQSADVEFVGVERDPLYASLARENVELNRQAHRVRIVEADALAPAEDMGVFDHVMLNPPYDAPGRGRPPGEAKRAALVSERPMGDWIKVWSNRMSGQGCLTMIQRAHRLGEVLDALRGRLGGVEIFPVRSSAGANASRIIVRAWKGSRAPLRLLAGLDLHPAGGETDKYTPQAEAILRGEAAIEFG